MYSSMGAGGSANSWGIPNYSRTPAPSRNYSRVSAFEMEGNNASSLNRSYLGSVDKPRWQRLALIGLAGMVVIFGILGRAGKHEAVASSYDSASYQPSYQDYASYGSEGAEGSGGAAGDSDGDYGLRGNNNSPSKEGPPDHQIQYPGMNPNPNPNHDHDHNHHQEGHDAYFHHPGGMDKPGDALWQHGDNKPPHHQPDGTTVNSPYSKFNGQDNEQPTIPLDLEHNVAETAPTQEQLKNTTTTPNEVDQCMLNPPVSLTQICEGDQDQECLRKGCMHGHSHAAQHFITQRDCMANPPKDIQDICAVFMKEQSPQPQKFGDCLKEGCKLGAAGARLYAATNTNSNLQPPNNNMMPQDLCVHHPLAEVPRICQPAINVQDCLKEGCKGPEAAKEYMEREGENPASIHASGNTVVQVTETEQVVDNATGTNETLTVTRASPSGDESETEEEGQAFVAGDGEDTVMEPPTEEDTTTSQNTTTTSHDDPETDVMLPPKESTEEAGTEGEVAAAPEQGEEDLDGEETGGETQAKKVICHGTSSDTTPYEMVEAKDSADHDMHMSDEHNSDSTYPDKYPGDQVTIGDATYTLADDCSLLDSMNGGGEDVVEEEGFGDAEEDTWTIEAPEGEQDKSESAEEEGTQDEGGSIVEEPANPEDSDSNSSPPPIEDLLLLPPNPPEGTANEVPASPEEEEKGGDGNEPEGKETLMDEGQDEEMEMEGELNTLDGEQEELDEQEEEGGGEDMEEFGDESEGQDEDGEELWDEGDQSEWEGEEEEGSLDEDGWEGQTEEEWEGETEESEDEEEPDMMMGDTGYEPIDSTPGTEENEGGQPVVEVETEPLDEASEQFDNIQVLEVPGSTESEESEEDTEENAEFEEEEYAKTMSENSKGDGEEGTDDLLDDALEDDWVENHGGEEEYDEGEGGDDAFEGDDAYAEVDDAAGDDQF